MAFRWAQPGQKIRLAYNAGDRNTSLYPQAEILDTDNSSIAIVDLTLDVTRDGWYVGEYTPNVAGNYNIRYVPYSDAGHTVENTTYPTADDSLFVANLPTTIMGGGASSSVGFTQKEFDYLIDNIWKKKFSDGRTAQEQLEAKSEFDPENDKVKIDYDFSAETKKITEIILHVSGRILKQFENIKEPKDYIIEFQQLKKIIKESKFETSYIDKKIDGFVDKISKYKQEIISSNVPLDKGLFDELNNNYNVLSKQLLEAIGNIPEPEKIDLSIFEKIRNEIKGIHPKDYSLQIGNLNAKIDNLEKIKLLIDEIEKTITDKQNSLLIILDRFIGSLNKRLDDMEHNIKSNQEDIANLIVSERRDD